MSIQIKIRKLELAIFWGSVSRNGKQKFNRHDTDRGVIKFILTAQISFLGKELEKKRPVIVFLTSR